MLNFSKNSATSLFEVESINRSSDWTSEPPRVYRRLPTLRRWSHHEQTLPQTISLAGWALTR